MSTEPWDGRRVYDYETGRYLGRAVGEPWTDGVEGLISLRQDEKDQTIIHAALCAFVVLDKPKEAQS